jgi:hypothetical protein
LASDDAPGQALCRLPRFAALFAHPHLKNHGASGRSRTSRMRSAGARRARRRRRRRRTSRALRGPPPARAQGFAQARPSPSQAPRSLCTRCMHSRMRLVSPPFNGDAVSPGFRRTISMDSLGGLPVNVEHVRHTVLHTPDPACPPRATILDLEGRGDRWSGDSGHGATNERRRHLTAIRKLAR